jgi:tRNA-dihydrouridine synthase B
MVPRGFWSTIPHPIIGLAPMDGVTDAAYRFITAKYGHPALVVTEFTSVEGIRAGATRLLTDFLYNPIERPIIAQLFGADPSAFYSAAAIVSHLGFDGIDINMGCPAKNVTNHGAGAALILDPERAKQIIRQAQAGTKAWAEGASLQELGIHPAIIEVVEARRAAISLPGDRTPLPVSVKTRLGYDQPVIDRWIADLLSVEPVAITLHGRTLKQLYSGLADWDLIQQAGVLVHQTNTLFLGNGDVSSLEDATTRILRHGLDGVLIGRATFGNPWVFQGIKEVDLQTRVQVALEHSRYLASIDERGFVRMRKHLIDYLSGIPNSKELRHNLVRVSSLAEVEALLLPLVA